MEDSDYMQKPATSGSVTQQTRRYADGYCACCLIGMFIGPGMVQVGTALETGGLTKLQLGWNCLGDAGATLVS